MGKNNELEEDIEIEEELEQVEMVSEDGDRMSFYVLEKTKVNGNNYIMVTDDYDEDSEEGNAYILKEIGSDDEDNTYIFVEDRTELEAVGKIFAELMDDEIVYSDKE